MIFSLVIGFLLGAGAIVFAFENTTVVALTFLNWQFQSSLALIVILSVLVGALISMLLSFPAAIRDRFRMHSLHKENKKLASALDDANHSVNAIIVDHSVPVVDV